MTDFPQTLVLPGRKVIITLYNLASVGAATGSLGAAASAVWPAANRAIYVPFRISESIVIQNLFLQNGSAVSGNFDIGILDIAGCKLVSSGSTAQAGVSVTQTVDITDTQIGPGLFYLALSFNNITATVLRSTSNARFLRLLGCAQEANAFPLPAVATFALVGSNYLPACGLAARSFV